MFSQLRTCETQGHFILYYCALVKHKAKRAFSARIMRGRWEYPTHPPSHLQHPSQTSTTLTHLPATTAAPVSDVGSSAALESMSENAKYKELDTC